MLIKHASSMTSTTGHLENLWDFKFLHGTTTTLCVPMTHLITPLVLVF